MDFEDRFGRALREAGQQYAIGAAEPLLERSLRRGRTLRGRRIAYAVVGSATAVAVAVAGTALSSPAPSAVTRPTVVSPSVSGAQIVSLLESMLPPGKVTATRGTGVGGGRPASVTPTADLVFNDGHGAAWLAITFSRASKSKLPTCSTGAKSATVLSCSESVLPNGSTVMALKENFGGSVLLWSVWLVTRNGDRAGIQETNSATGNPSSKVSRAAPPLSTAQLSAIVADSAWSPVFTALRAPAGSAGQPTQAQVTAIARQLQPAGTEFVAQNGATTFLVSRNGVVSNDMIGTRLSIAVQRWPAQARSEIRPDAFASATRLPDGTLMTTDQSAPTSSIRVWRISVLKPDGTLVELNEQATSRVGTTVHPALSMDELKTIALSPLWSR
ncbi:MULTISPECIES: hypothetical protein [Streptacidiphilus]|uniref:Uncharacterized protein n=1 Tax=Streptacidiphilus cavernicola TaxID=3342716 RepID=A0ABV6URR7_9ACTN|nr:hypothetical protein [Streptacidiphilus jeojiense]